MRTRLVPFIAAMVFLSACSSADTDPKTPAGSDGGDQNATADSDDDGDAPSVEIVASGFGQSKYSTQAMVVVTTDDESAIGESVTVSVNFLDAEGMILNTTEQIESFKWVGQELALPVSPYDLDEKAKVASIEASASLSDYGSEPARAALPVLESTEIVKGQFSDWSASFGFTNDTDEDLKDLRVGVVCYDAAGAVIGGTSTYPELAPAGKTIRITSDPTVSSKPSSCKAFVNYDVI